MSNEQTPLLRDEGDIQALEATASRTIEARTPLPWKSFIILLLLTAVPPLAFDIIFPFVNQMILENGIATNPENVGFYSGLIESIFSVMSFLTVLPLSHLSDVIGRKPVLLGGLLGLAVSLISFGISKTFIAMIVSRCLGGALGGTQVTIKVMLAEMTDKTNQSRAFQMNTLAYRIGQIIGLPLGGLLSHPERNIPIFRADFWRKYPFALPCFVAAGFTIISVAIGIFYLRETLLPKERPVSQQFIVPPSFEDPEVVVDTPNQTSQSVSRGRGVSYKEALTRPIIQLIIAYSIAAFMGQTLFAVFPLFCFTPISSGGLGMSEAAIGIQLGIRSFLHIGILFFYDKLERYCGSTVKLHRIIMWSFPLSIMCMPLLNILARTNGSDTWAMYAAMFILFAVWSVGGFSWMTLSIMLTNAAPSNEALATVNGLTQSALILPEASGPVLSTSFFALSIESGVLGGNLIWIFLLVIALIGTFHSMTLEEPTSNWRTQQQN